MGSWTQGVLAATGMAVDLATGIGNLVINAQNADANRKLVASQMAALEANLQLQKRAQDIELTMGNPNWRYDQAIKAGFDQLSASQFAGRTAPRISGGVHLLPIKQMEVDAINRTRLASQGLVAGQLFSHGAPGPRRQMVAGRPVFFHEGNRGERVNQWVRDAQSRTLSARTSSYGTWSSNSTQSTSLSGFGHHSPRPLTIGHGGARSVWSSSSV